jgi:hypothetical protein
MRVFRGKSNEDCKEHMELSHRIDALEREIRILKCDDHVWEPVWSSLYVEFHPRVNGMSLYICKKCGETKYLTDEELRDIELARALDEVERLGGEVTR